MGLMWNGRSSQKFEVHAEVTETLTEITLSDTAVFTAHRFNIKIETLQQPNLIKPGLSYEALVS